MQLLTLDVLLCGFIETGPFFVVFFSASIYRNIKRTAAVSVEETLLIIIPNWNWIYFVYCGHYLSLLVHIEPSI